MYKNNNTVFAVDDEIEILDLYASVLGAKKRERLNFFDALDDQNKQESVDLHTFENGEEYLKTLQKYYNEGKRVPLSILDMRLPGKHGLEIAKEARKIDPDMTIVIITAYADYSVYEVLGQLQQNLYFLRKPFREDELYVLILTNLQHWNAKFKATDLQKELAVDSIEDGLWDWNIKTNEVYFSKRWKEMLGYQDDEIKNTLNEWSKRVHPDDMSKVKQDIDAHFSHKTEFYVNEHRLRCKDGSYKWILDRGKALFDPHGEAYRMTGFHTDISERKRLEEELYGYSNSDDHEKITTYMKLKHTNAELEKELHEEIEKRKANERLLLQQTRQAAMGEMISMIAHQWRQPITSIALGADNIMMDIALESLNEEELVKTMTMIRNQVDYLSSTIDDFRDFFRPDKPRELITIHECLDASLSIIEKSLQSHGIDVQKDLKDVSELSLYKNELVQVFLNLLKNSQDVLLQHKVEKPFIVIHTQENEQHIQITISDNGRGIPPELLLKIYEPYFTTKDEHNGTGLGLYMSKTIIEEHFCGTINAENTDLGAKFTLTIPRECIS